MNEYTVTWAIELSASSPEEAAHLAREIQEGPNNTATVFCVRGAQGEAVHIDTALTDDPE